MSMIDGFNRKGYFEVISAYLVFSNIHAHTALCFFMPASTAFLVGHCPSNDCPVMTLDVTVQTNCTVGEHITVTLTSLSAQKPFRLLDPRDAFPLPVTTLPLPMQHQGISPRLCMFSPHTIAKSCQVENCSP